MPPVYWALTPEVPRHREHHLPHEHPYTDTQPHRGQTTKDPDKFTNIPPYIPDHDLGEIPITHPLTDSHNRHHLHPQAHHSYRSQSHSHSRNHQSKLVDNNPPPILHPQVVQMDLLPSCQHAWSSISPVVASLAIVVILLGLWWLFMRSPIGTK
ncbi:hypothetical protein M501DRAFT_1014801 [Patellaria atrata CBS 101060]|uniref:Uncharacterized protein n=1 Tax=Patellaria atrata CBS 101060 TaxID=1346257 RepID=A0A9P4SDR1_9PEZI|nr:hypothetical protein M501DRAFT_1014801 [Patellaria atrata CBS 101060]